MDAWFRLSPTETSESFFPQPHFITSHPAQYQPPTCMPSLPLSWFPPSYDMSSPRNHPSLSFQSLVASLKVNPFRKLEGIPEEQHMNKSSKNTMWKIIHAKSDPRRIVKRKKRKKRKDKGKFRRKHCSNTPIFSLQKTSKRPASPQAN